jgi:hypothetical protein
MALDDQHSKMQDLWVYLDALVPTSLHLPVRVNYERWLFRCPVPLCQAASPGANARPHTRWGGAANLAFTEEPDSADACCTMQSHTSAS